MTSALWRACADRVAVMYAGKVVEDRHDRADFLRAQASVHAGAARSLPSADAGKREPLMRIPGTPPDLL